MTSTASGALRTLPSAGLHRLIAILGLISAFRVVPSGPDLDGKVPAHCHEAERLSAKSVFLLPSPPPPGRPRSLQPFSYIREEVPPYSFLLPRRHRLFSLA